MYSCQRKHPSAFHYQQIRHANRQHTVQAVNTNTVQPAINEGVGYEVAPPTFQGTLVSAEPPSYELPSYNADEGNKDQDTDIPLPGQPSPQHLSA